MNLDDLRRELESVVAARPGPSRETRSRIERRVKRRRGRQLVALGAVVTAVAAALTVAVGANDVARRPAFQLVVSARPSTGSAVFDERFRLDVQWPSGGLSRDMRGRRVVDFAAGTSAAIYPATDGDGYEEITGPTASYYHYPSTERDALRVDTAWIGVEGDVVSAGYIGPQLPALTPDGVLDHVRRGQRSFYTKVTEVGREPVRGVATIRYRLVADPDRLREQFEARGVPADVARRVRAEATAELWVDNDRLIRRIVVRNVQVWPDLGFSERVTIEQEVDRYGVAVPRVQLPRAGTVTWMSFADLGTRFAMAGRSSALQQKQEKP